MPRGKILTDSEKAVISELDKLGKSVRYISKRLNRSRCVISTYLADPEKYGRKSYAKKRSKVSETALHRLIRYGREGRWSSKGLVSCILPTISASHCRRLLRGPGKLRYMKRKASPDLTPAHKKQRVEFSEWGLANPERVQNGVWSDYKVWSLDGPDGLQKGWSDPTLRRKHRKSRQNGGGKLMTWGAICKGARLPIAFLDRKQDAKGHTETLKENLLPFYNENKVDSTGQERLFQQDKASIHTAKHTKMWLMENGVGIMPWSAKSPDLNPIENLWYILSTRVYANGTQYDSKEALQKAIQKAWDELDVEKDIDTLIDSMPRRFQSVIELKGEITKY